MKDIDLAEYPHVEMAIQSLAPITRNSRNMGFNKSMLMTILDTFRSDNWFGGELKRQTNNNPVVMKAFNDGMDELNAGISTAMNLNYVDSRRNAREFQVAQNIQYWSEEEGNEGEGTRAKKIVLREKKLNPDIKLAQLAIILTKERVLNFRGRMTLPHNRQDSDFHWGYQQVYNLMIKYMGVKVNSEQNELLERQQFQENQKLYWSADGDGAKAKTIILRELGANPKISDKKLAGILTRERVLKFRSIHLMKFPQERKDVDFQWDSYQVKHIRTKYMSMDANV